MENIESNVIDELKLTSTYDGSVDIVVASKIVDSEPLYQDGVQRVISSTTLPTTAQAKRLGVEATHTVMTKILEKLIEMRIESVTNDLTAKHQQAINTLNSQHQETLKSEAATASADRKKCRGCQRVGYVTCQSCYTYQ
jgi:hypothetical protein